MLIIKGVNVFPSQVESVLVGMKEISPYYQLVVSKKGYVAVSYTHLDVYKRQHWGISHVPQRGHQCIPCFLLPQDV